MASKISASILTFNNIKTIKDLIESVIPHVDEIVVVDSGSTDGTLEVLKSFNIIVLHRDWNKNFSDARNFAFSKCTGEWIIWLDSDDTLVHGEKLRHLVEKLEAENKICANLIYHYQWDKEGNCILTLERERILKAGHFKWTRSVHEVAVPIRSGSRIKDFSVWVDHHPLDMNESLVRNIEILEHEVTTNPTYDTLDLYYLGKHFFTVGDHERCVKCLHKFIERSKKSHFVYQTLLMLGIVYALENVQKGIDYFMKAIVYQPDWQEAYFNIGYFTIDIGENEKGAYWIHEGIKRNDSPPPYMYNPMGLYFQPYYHLGRAFMNMDETEEALKWYEKALEYCEDEKTRNIVNVLKGIKDDNETAQKISDLKEYIDFSKLPQNLKDHPLVESLMPEFSKPGGIAFFCGNNWEDWGPQSQASGIGGSEEALIEITRELAKLGHKIEVYTNCIEEGVYDGVEWRDYRRFNTKRPFDAIVFWRSAHLLDINTVCKNRFIWHQDVIEPNIYTIDRVNSVNKIFVLSKWHRMNAPDIPDDKFYLTRNGFLYKERIGKLPTIRRMHHFVSMSSYDRGLQWTLESWEKIKKEIPDAVLHVCYGWNTFDKAHSENPEQMRWKSYMMDLMKQDGIEQHGRISHEELEKLIYSCEYWIYSSTFCETSCISGIKAQAFGAIPLTNKLAALDETVRWGFKCDKGMIKKADREYFFDEVIKYVKTPKDFNIKDMMEDTRKFYDYKLIASEWSRDLFTKGETNGEKNESAIPCLCETDV